MSDALKTYAEINARIAAAAQSWSRKPEHVNLVAVSKTFDASHIVPFLAAGHRVFGENRVQEAAGKWPQLRESYADIELHLIGPLQTNKAEEAIGLFDVIETLDREKLAVKLASLAEKGHKLPRLFIQVNTGAEPQKSGILPEQALDFISQCRETYQLPIIGLMCIPPVEEHPAPHFALLATLAEQAGLSELSMGMSEDFEAAIAQGASYVRLGRALFGAR